ncbi:MAG: hypothetical protein EXR93_06840 [Gemmatimonadetes bacterium]|nr:hypothetical protein [Gemmatimonadota bacterium]
MPRALALLLLLAPMDLPAQTPDPRVRIVVYRLDAAFKNTDDSLLARSVGRALVRALNADSTFAVLDRPGAPRPNAPPVETAQYAVVGSVAALGSQARVDLRVVDILKVSLLTHPSILIPDRNADGAIVRAGEALAKQIHQHFATVRR